MRMKSPTAEHSDPTAERDDSFRVMQPTPSAVNAGMPTHRTAVESVTSALRCALVLFAGWFARHLVSSGIPHGLSLVGLGYTIACVLDMAVAILGMIDVRDRASSAGWWATGGTGWSSTLSAFLNTVVVACARRLRPNAPPGLVNRIPARLSRGQRR